jgi:CDP-diacylglycerol---serine O-phosphatidyltransferase
MTIRRAIPSLITLAALTVGLGAIRAALLGEGEEAAWLILGAMLLDQLDGAAARGLNARTRIGAELDSFSDFVAFGLAPAFVLIGAPSPDAGPAWLLGERALAVVYVCGCALRLARYNTHDAPAGLDVFRGLPSTLAGALAAAAVLTASAHGVRLRGLVLAVLLGVLGVLMVSDPLRPPKIHVLAGRLAARGRLGRVTVIATLALVYATVLARVLPEYVLGLALLYATAGSLLGRRRVITPTLTPSGVAESSG